MTFSKDFNGRVFTEGELFQPIERRIAGCSSNNLWLYTVESGFEYSKHTQEKSDSPIVKIIRWQARNNGNDGQKRWAFRKSYNIRSLAEWQATSRHVDSLIRDGARTSFIPIVQQGESLVTERTPADTSATISAIRGIKELSFAERIELETYRQKITLLSKNVRQLEAILEKYKRLISDNSVLETDVQNFLKENNAYWMFGLEYIGIESKKRFPPKSRDYHEFDIMLKRYDGFWDLAELKGPNENLFDKRTKEHDKPNRKLAEALGQVFTYLGAIDRKGQLSLYKPRAYIVIGKDKTDFPRARRLFSSYLSKVDVITHSDLYHRGCSCTAPQLSSPG